MLARPHLPIVCDLFEHCDSIEWTRQGVEGVRPRHHERDRLAFFDFEIGQSFEVLAPERDRGVENDAIRPRDGA